MSSLMLTAFVALSIAVGAVFPFQAGVNSMIGRQLGAPLYGGLTNTLVASATFVVAILILRPGLPHLKAASEAPLWAWSGGVMGAAMVFGSLFIAPKIGASSFITATIAGSLLASLIVDHFGILNFPVSEAGLMKISGIAMVFVGMLIVQFAK